MRAAQTPVLLILLALGGCATQVMTDRPADSCSTLVPDAWSQGVAGEPLPGLGATIGDWESFADGQTGDLDIANSREKQTITIVSRCEARDAQLVQSLNHKPWWQVF